MNKTLAWGLVIVAVVIGGWLVSQYQSMTTSGQPQSAVDASSQPATAPEAAVSGDLKAADQDANSIDFTNDFSADDLNSATQ